MYNIPDWPNGTSYYLTSSPLGMYVYVLYIFIHISPNFGSQKVGLQPCGLDWMLNQLYVNKGLKVETQYAHYTCARMHENVFFFLEGSKAGIILSMVKMFFFFNTSSYDSVS